MIWFNCDVPGTQPPPDDPIGNSTVALLVHEANRREHINGAILSVHKNTPIQWPLYVIYASIARDPIMAPWIKGLPFNEVLKSAGRSVIYREMNDAYYGHSQNTPAMDVEFWKQFSEDFLFFFHADSGMCHPPNFPYNLSDFFNFDYVGAPWSGPGRAYQTSTVYVGNGGFSIRNRTFMIECIQRGHRNDGISLLEPEDYYFALCAQRFGRFCSYDIARYFAIETVDEPPEGSFGYHGEHCPWGCNQDRVDRWLKMCPETSYVFVNGTCCH